MITLKEQIISGYQITFNEAIELSTTANKELLYQMAGDIKSHFLGNSIEMCTIINARSGKCSENCKWCSQSAFHKTDIDVYDFIAPQVAIKQAKENAGYGVAKFSLVTSGRTISNTDLKKACSIYTTIKKDTDIKLCASMGLLTKEQLVDLKNVGVEHYHCNLETSASHFDKVCSTHTIEEKLQTISWAKEAGLEICSGGIIGMGENMQQRVELAFELRNIGAVSIPVNILQPVKGTALDQMLPLTDEEILTTFALFRIINPTAQIRFAAGRSQIAHIQRKALQSGISAALVGNLLTTIGSKVEDDLALFDEMNLNVVR